MERLIRVLLADDHPLIRTGIRTTLLAESDLALVGEASNGDEVQQMCGELKPDVLLLDVQMPGPPAVQTVNFVRMRCPDMRIVILTAYDNDVYVRGLIAAGAVGYVLKDEATQVVVRAVRTVMQGDTWFGRPVVERMARLAGSEAPVSEQAQLSEREREIVRLVAKGQSNPTIAKTLSIAEPTVRFHLRNIYDKIGVHSRTEAAIWAVKHGWGDGE